MRVSALTVRAGRKAAGAYADAATWRRSCHALRGGSVARRAGTGVNEGSMQNIFARFCADCRVL